jgi:hypothetical protein
MQDLVLVVPDKDTEQALSGLLKRPESIQIRPIDFVVRVHPQKDPGCYHTGHELAATSRREASHALVVFDLAWEGAPSNDAGVLQHHVEDRLRPLWGDDCACIVIDPELEVWVWSDSPHVAEALGWQGHAPALREWLEEQGLWPHDASKPADPEAAFRRVMRKTKLPPSAAIFRRLADSVGLNRCTDPSLLNLLSILRRWFGDPPPFAVPPLSSCP